MSKLAADHLESVVLPDVLPVLPTKDAVVFPYIILPLSVGPDKSALAVDHAIGENRLVMLVGQRDPKLDDPSPADLQEIGTAGLIMRMLKLPDGRVRILVQGVTRARLLHVTRTEPFLHGRVERLADAPPAKPSSLERAALVRNVREGLEQAAQLGKNVSPEVLVVAANVDDPGRLADLAASNLDLEAAESQELLETLDPALRLKRVSDLLHRELDLLAMQNELSNQARGEIDRSQREYFLRQQMKAIQDELGEGEDFAQEIAGYRLLADERGMPPPARDELEKQIRRLERSHPDSAENAVIRSYLDWLSGLPWAVASEDNLDLDHVRRILDEDHYDLEKVKERILEFLAVRRLKGDSKGPILCFVGPPGVGKTSLGRSIARALGRQFVRIALGGVRDEAEIRGHRRTYVGALPGRVVQGLHQARTSNPVFMLDEIDKLGADYRGDPASALLEVLDPEQRSGFRDHYLGVEIDLSRVLFITTANLLDPIQPAFLDRMEILRLSGYTEEEKLAIARRHLLPKQLAENGLEPRHLHLTDAGLRQIIRGYTREAGLRNLEREIAAICRKQAVEVAGGRERRRVVGPRSLEGLLGPEKHYHEALLDHDRVGVATGLAWTATGGDLLFIEVVAVPGKGKLHLTGQLGEVMRESAQAALSYARSYASRHGVDARFFAEHDLHVHAPAGAVPKDGPSAGITIATALVSVLTEVPVRRSLAMTGEITLRGDVLPIGGLKEKALAARNAGITTVLVPRHNRRDVGELPPPVRKALDLVFVDHMDAVLERALAPVAAGGPASSPASVAGSASVAARAAGP